MHFLSLFSREIGTIFYSLGFFPTQADLQKFTSEVSTASSRSLVLFWKISNGMCKQGSDIVHFSNVTESPVPLCDRYKILGNIRSIVFVRKFKANPNSLFLCNQVEDERSGYIHWDRFLPAMTKVLLEDK